MSYLSIHWHFIPLFRTEDLESDEEMCAYEKLRMKNIEERKKKFEEFKLANLVSAVSSSFSKKTTNPKMSKVAKKNSPQPRRIMPSRNCKPQNQLKSAFLL